MGELVQANNAVSNAECLDARGSVFARSGFGRRQGARKWPWDGATKVIKIDLFCAKNRLNTVSISSGSYPRYSYLDRNLGNLRCKVRPEKNQSRSRRIHQLILKRKAMDAISSVGPFSWATRPKACGRPSSPLGGETLTCSTDFAATVEAAAPRGDGRPYPRLGQWPRQRFLARLRRFQAPAGHQYRGRVRQALPVADSLEPMGERRIGGCECRLLHRCRRRARHRETRQPCAPAIPGTRWSGWCSDRRRMTRWS